MKNAKKIGIAIVQVVTAGIVVFVAIQHCTGNKPDDIDIGQVAAEEVEETPESSATDESLTDSTVKSELENKENISENNDLHANAGGSGEISLEQTEDGSFKDPAIDHQTENEEAENNITSEPVIEGHDTETTDNLPKKSVDLSDEDTEPLTEEETTPDLPTDEDMQWAMDLIEQNGTVLH